jgi:calcium/calmodulin-dependent protein kinase-4
LRKRVVDRRAIANSSTSSAWKPVEEDFELHPERVLGSGCSGQVILAVDRRSRVEYAVKTFRKEDLSKDALKFLQNEVAINIKLQHAHIASLNFIYETKDTLSLVMELCTGGELFTRLQERGAYTEVEAAHAAKQMLLAVDQLHMSKIAHRDLKLENWLYAGNGDDADLKLIDFGFSASSASIMNEDHVGTISYCAPEVLRGWAYTEKCDMWSFGVIMFALLSGRLPFNGASEDEKRARILDCEYALPEHISDLARDFIGRLLTVDSAQRMSAQESLHHPWIAAAKCGDIQQASDGELGN